MRVKIGPPPQWFGPYQLAEWLCWWAPHQPDEYGIDEPPPWVHKFGEWLAYGSQPRDTSRLEDTRTPTRLHRLLSWIYAKRRRKTKVTIDRSDLWSGPETLKLVILPMLIKIREQKQGAPGVDDQDVPPHLRSDKGTPGENGNPDSLYFERWNWVIDEIIWAFEQLGTDWESQYSHGEHDTLLVPSSIGYELVRGPNDTYRVDHSARDQHQQRITRGLTLFGRYYENLWL